MDNKDQNIVALNENHLLASRFLDELKGLIAFDLQRDKPYNLIAMIYDNAERIKQVSANFAGVKNELEPLTIGLGNINGIVKNFFENKPGLIINKNEILEATDLEKLKNTVRSEFVEREKMEKLEEKWNEFIDELREKKVEGNLPLPPLPKELEETEDKNM